MRTAQVECIVFRKNAGAYEFLVLRRIPDKGGFWQPITGGFEQEDSSKLAAAYRELLEEAGISKEDVIRVLEDVYTFEFSHHYLTGAPIQKLTEYVFGFEVSPEAKVSIENNVYPEHDEFRWVCFEDALSLLKWDSNKDALKKLNGLLKQGE